MVCHQQGLPRLAYIYMAILLLQVKVVTSVSSGKLTWDSDTRVGRSLVEGDRIGSIGEHTIVRWTKHWWKARIWLLYPEYLSGIWTGQTLNRLSNDTLIEYPEPWSWYITGRGSLTVFNRPSEAETVLLLFTVYFLLSTFYCLLYIVYGVLYCVLSTFYCLPYTVYCLLYFV